MAISQGGESDALQFAARALRAEDGAQANKIWRAPSWSITSQHPMYVLTLEKFIGFLHLCHLFERQNIKIRIHVYI